MFQHQKNQQEKGARSTERSAAPRGRTAHSAPSSSNTRETKSDSYSPHGVGIGLEVWATDGTERGTITTNGKRSTITLTPIPLDTASPEVAHINWLAFSFTPPASEHDSIAQLLAQLAPLFGLPRIPAVCKGKG